MFSVRATARRAGRFGRVRLTKRRTDATSAPSLLCWSRGGPAPRRRPIFRNPPGRALDKPGDRDRSGAVASSSRGACCRASAMPATAAGRAADFPRIPFSVIRWRTVASTRHTFTARLPRPWRRENGIGCASGDQLCSGYLTRHPDPCRLPQGLYNQRGAGQLHVLFLRRGIRWSYCAAVSPADGFRVLYCISTSTRTRNEQVAAAGARF